MYPDVSMAEAEQETVTDITRGSIVKQSSVEGVDLAAIPTPKVQPVIFNPFEEGATSNSDTHLLNEYGLLFSA